MMTTWSFQSLMDVMTILEPDSKFNWLRGVASRAFA